MLILIQNTEAKLRERTLILRRKELQTMRRYRRPTLLSPKDNARYPAARIPIATDDTREFTWSTLKKQNDDSLDDPPPYGKQINDDSAAHSPLSLTAAITQHAVWGGETGKCGAQMNEFHKKIKPRAVTI